MVSGVEDDRLELVDGLEDRFILHVLFCVEIWDEAFPGERCHHHKTIDRRAIWLIPHEVEHEQAWIGAFEDELHVQGLFLVALLGTLHRA